MTFVNFYNNSNEILHKNITSGGTRASLDPAL
jgi:hypothetical protein